MFYLVYVSNATRPLDDAELRDVMTISRQSNAQIEVTGLLLYKDGHFMQMIEGEEKVVRALLEKITRDPRHYNVLTLQEGVSDHRQFPDWSMGFRRLDGERAEEIPGYRDFADATFREAEFLDDPSRCLRLLRLFKDRI